MRILPLGLIVLLASACGGIEYKDSNRAVDANPVCVDRPSHPGDPVAAECERKTEAVWSSEKSSDREPIDFSGKKH